MQPMKGHWKFHWKLFQPQMFQFFKCYNSQKKMMRMLGKGNKPKPSTAGEWISQEQHSPNDYTCTLSVFIFHCCQSNNSKDSQGNKYSCHQLVRVPEIKKKVISLSTQQHI